MSYLYLEVIRGLNAGSRYELPEGPASLGRSPQSTVRLHPKEKPVSAHHAILYVSPGQYVLQDLQSTNGTFLNEERVEEQAEVHPGDEIGFGKTGPRLKLVTSPVRLQLETEQSTPPADPGLDTTAGGTRCAASVPDATAGEFEAESQDQRDSLRLPNSMTEVFARKLKDNRLGSAEIRDLMRDGGRVKRLIGKESLSNEQRHMLGAMYGAHRLTQRQWQIIVGVVVVLALAGGIFAFMRIQHYRAQLREAHKVEEQLDDYEKRIAAARKDPNHSKEDLRRLVGEFEKKENVFASMRAQVDDEDFRKYYADPLERQLDAILAQFGETNYHVPPDMVERVRHHVGIYSGRLKKRIGLYLRRKKDYFPLFHRVLREKKLPLELSYIAMLESGLSPTALSHAGARGLWQFMPRTARGYGLRVDKTVDERTDPEKATVAAAEYFKDLIGIFGGSHSVMLAMAAYNAGEGRLMGALKKIDDPLRDRDFWYIYRMGYLAEETNEYIPRVLALMVIDSNPKEYGFDLEN